MRLNKDTYKGFRSYPERILQFGGGNFLRAFVDWMVDKINREVDFNGSVVVVQSFTKGLLDKLNEQDGLYTVYLNGIKNGQVVSEHLVINCISRAINPFIDYEGYLKAAENPDLRFIFSNTTEAGIAFDKNDKLEDRPQKSFPGKLTSFLYRRFRVFNGDNEKGFIIIPCELIDKNGEMLKSMVLRYTELWNLGEEFVKWIEEGNIFCNSLVDRIVTGYPRDKIEQISRELPYEDSLIDEGEQFHLWVIEGPQWIEEEFPVQRAGLNVVFVDDLTPYRTRKVRILNGAHTSLMPVAYLYGVNTVKEAVEHEVIGKFLHGVLFDEIIPTLDLPRDELEYFAGAVLDRFKNPFIKHYLISISLNSMSKYETRVIPSLIEYYNRKGKLPEKLVFSLAALIEFYKGKRGSENIPVTDVEDVMDLYRSLWESYDGSEEALKDIVAAVLGYERNWKMDLNKIEGLTDKVTYYLARIEKEGMKEAISEVL